MYSDIVIVLSNDLLDAVLLSCHEECGLFEGLKDDDKLGFESPIVLILLIHEDVVIHMVVICMGLVGSVGNCDLVVMDWSDGSLQVGALWVLWIVCPSVYLLHSLWVFPLLLLINELIVA